MPNIATIEVKAFVPSRDFALSKRFYNDLGFAIAWSHDHVAEVRHGEARFLLQNFYNAEHAANFMIHLFVADLDAWWDHVQR
ncbi:VOC family protein [Plastoroseomonas arctica]|uniref:VOC family protein n=1 Tax=Plastoroseomonas arctica TaxID=1509237 RepID=UPI001BA5AF83|nr:VOC family protein [Plastoroseomonas arctica]